MCDEYMGTMPGVPHRSCICTRVMVTWGLCQVPHKDHVCEMHTLGLCQMSRIDHVCVMCMRRLCNVFRSIVHHPMPLKWGFSLNLVQADIQHQGPPVSVLQNVGLHSIRSYLLSRLPTPSTILVRCPLCPSSWNQRERYLSDSCQM